MRANTVAQTLPLLAGYSLNILVTPLMITKLGINAFGVWAISGAISQYGALFDFGITRSVTRFIAYYGAKGDRAAERRTRSLALCMLVLLTLLLLVIAVGLAPFAPTLMHGYNVAECRLLLVSAVLILALGLLSRAVASMAFGQNKLVLPNLALACSNIIMVGTGAVSLYLWDGLVSFGIATAAGSLLGFIIVIIATRLCLGEFRLSRPQYGEAKEILAFGIKNQAVSVSDIFVMQFGKIVLGFTVGPSAVGAYEVGSRLASGARALGIVMTMTALPTLSARYSLKGLQGVRAMYPDITIRFNRLAFIPSFGLAATAPLAVTAWLGEPNASISIVLFCMSIAFAINLATGMQTVAANAAGRPDLVATPAIASAVLSVASAVPLGFAFGIYGVLASLLISVSTGALIETYLVGRFMSIDIGSAIHMASTAALAPLTAAAIVFLVSIGIQTDTWPASIVLLLLAATLYLLVAIFVTWLQTRSSDEKTTSAQLAQGEHVEQ